MGNVKISIAQLEKIITAQLKKASDSGIDGNLFIAYDKIPDVTEKIVDSVCGIGKIS